MMVAPCFELAAGAGHAWDGHGQKVCRDLVRR